MCGFAGLWGKEWRGQSDTETLLACFEAWGVEQTLQRTEGMFAFALLDRQERVLRLGRDRLGEKPLYYGWVGGAFVFRAELKALRQLRYSRAPRDLIERLKAGFGIPVGEWLRGPLREWAEGLLEAARLEREGYLNPKPIREAWKQHQSGRYDWTPRLWSVLMFQAWLEASA